MKNLNSNEIAVLVAITKSEYQNGGTDESDLVNYPVWSFSIQNYDLDILNITGKKISGFVSSLKKKGYVNCSNDKINASYDDNTVSLTKQGFDYLKENNLLN